MYYNLNQIVNQMWKLHINFTSSSKSSSVELPDSRWAGMFGSAGRGCGMLTGEIKLVTCKSNPWKYFEQLKKTYLNTGLSMVFRGRKSCTMYARMALVISFDFIEDSLLFFSNAPWVNSRNYKIIWFFLLFTWSSLWNKSH